MVNWYKKCSKKDIIPGGKADKKNPKDFDPEQLARGKKVEMEHTDDPDLAEEIAMDHLEEFSDYYDALDDMENELKKEHKKDNDKTSAVHKEQIIKQATAFNAEDIETFKDRRDLNERIREFKTLAKKIAFLRKAISQNPPGAQSLLRNILKTKIFTSYPDIKALLEEAEALARDNYNKFSEICDIVLEKIYLEIKKLESVRSRLVNHVLPKRMKERMRKHDRQE